MQFGLFTCGYQRLSLETAFRDAANFGYDYIELWGGRPHAFAPDLLSGEAAEFRRLIQRYHMPVRVYTPEHNAYPYNYMLGSQTQWESCMAYLADALRAALRESGWAIEPGDPLRLTLRGDGHAIARTLRNGGIEPEYADRAFCVLMAAPENRPEDFDRIAQALGKNILPEREALLLPRTAPEAVCPPREALFSPHETIPAMEALGRVCGAPTVSCPPAIPIAVSGECIGPREIDLFRYYGVETVDVLIPILD